ncbi:MAG: YeeE/YedE family protein [Burkholderiaceae bacterium]|nr:YeeE/YedE family protein [Burkholderiaceae bacterium]MCD8517171.1 YeeE/YedE family protein [Burkholderiaceae bacterium]MCD8536437.1 YeeE/YedE family protein [Burkholderiaceae bacterium]MCD8565283.1 YeeE/YedE family protein [Burkholderiaceae bacterium]
MELSASQWVLWLALAIGLAYGLVGQISGFCLNSALRQQLTSGNGNKLRAFALAMLVAILGSQLLDATGVIDLSQSIYSITQGSLVLTAVGGILFGFGMIRARGCGARSLVLLGQGNLRSLVVLLVMGIAAFATLSGVLGPLRSSITDSTMVTMQSATFTSETDRWGFIAIFGGLLFAFLARDKGFWRQRLDVMAGFVIGLLVVAGWLVTGWIGFDEFEPTPLVSLTFVAPVGSTIQYAMIATGMTLNFGILVVIGVVLGSFLAARVTGSFKVTGFDQTTAMPRYLLGATCMGVGGALALGCSIGQGLTGMSTLSYMSMLSFAGICTGGWLALRLERSSITSSEPVQRQTSGEQHQQSA